MRTAPWRQASTSASSCCASVNDLDRPERRPHTLVPMRASGANLVSRTAPSEVATSEWIAALASGVLVLVATALLFSSAAAQERTGDPAKWRNYWTQLYTVFTHPRCLNCHGATDPDSGENHGGG